MIDYRKAPFEKKFSRIVYLATMKNFIQGVLFFMFIFLFLPGCWLPLLLDKHIKHNVANDDDSVTIMVMIGCFGGLLVYGAIIGLTFWVYYHRR